jgi:hypothetical protein
MLTFWRLFMHFYVSNVWWLPESNCDKSRIGYGKEDNVPYLKLYQKLSGFFAFYSGARKLRVKNDGEI